MGVKLDPATREVGVRFYMLLSCMDTHVSKTRNIRRAWVEIAAALGLPSVQGNTLTQLGDELGVTRQAVSKGGVTFLRMSQLPPAFGMKSEAARRTYAITNGRRADSVEPSAGDFPAA